MANLVKLLCLTFFGGIVIMQVNANPAIAPTHGQAEPGTIEIHGVSAGEFNPAFWEKGTLNLVPDWQSPLMRPRKGGVFRNIYAPSPVALPDGSWRVFYGAWDGVLSGNDRIYSVITKDFIDFSERNTVIEHGQMIHACNVNALMLPDGSYAMVCTVLPEQDPSIFPAWFQPTEQRPMMQNYPAFFTSPDGKIWNGDPEPHLAQISDIINLQGYEKDGKNLYANADVNGMNVILYEDGAFHLYFGDFFNFGEIRRATSTDGGKTFNFDGVSLKADLMVNDVKKFEANGKSWYLMGCHHNAQKLFYALSNDGMAFNQEQLLGANLGDHDKYMVALGWVARDNKLLGFLYGAGETRSLNNNRIYGRWLQKKVVFVAEDGTRYEGTSGLGPDRQVISVPKDRGLKGHFEVYAEDGQTLLIEKAPAEIGSGQIFVFNN